MNNSLSRMMEKSMRIDSHHNQFDKVGLPDKFGFLSALAFWFQ